MTFVRQSCVIGALALVMVVLISPVATAATQNVTFSDCRSALDNQVVEVVGGNDLTISFTTCPAAVTSTLYLGSSTPVLTTTSTMISGAEFARVFQIGKWAIDGYASSGIDRALPVGSYEIFFRLYDNFNNVSLYTGSFIVNVMERTSDSTSLSPAPVLQQFGRPASGTCDGLAPESLNWSGVESGGWGESWAEWMNGGNGGAVCTRTLVYSTAQSKWVVG